MNNLRKQLSLAIVLLLAASFSLSPAEESLRIELEQVYKRYITAYSTGDVTLLRATMSSFVFGSMMNNLSDSKRSLTPDTMKSIAKYKIDISKMKFIKLIENGPTVGLVYSRDIEVLDIQKNRKVAFAVVKFVKENSGWKVDASFSQERPKYQSDGRETEFDIRDLPEELTIDGKVLPAPIATPEPYAVGLLDVMPGRYKISVIINDVAQPFKTREAGFRQIKNGLRVGINTVNIFVEKDADSRESSSTPRVTIQRRFSDNRVIDVFKYEPKNIIVGEHMFSFTIDQ